MLSFRLRYNGFSFIEVIIIIVILAVVIAVAYPSYEQYLVNTRRGEGRAILMRVMEQQQRYFANGLTYTTNLTELGYPVASGVTSQEGHYKVRAIHCDTPFPGSIQQCVKLIAEGQGGQASDDESGQLSLYSTGVMTPTEKW